MTHGATRRLRRAAARRHLDLRGLDPRQQRRLVRRLARWEATYAGRLWLMSDPHMTHNPFTR